MLIPLSKIKAILLYLSNNTNTRYLGKIKLMKLFYFLDFLHVKEYGMPITFDTYYHLKNGPIPTYIMNLVTDAGENGDNTILSDVVTFKTPEGTERMIQTVPNRKFSEKDAQIFMESELKILKRVCDQFRDATTDEIIEASHQESPWLQTRMSQIIPYSLAARDPDSKFTEQEIELSAKILG